MLYLHYTVAFHTGPGKERKKLKDKTNNQAMNTEPKKKKNKPKLRIPCTDKKFNYDYSRRITL